MARIPYSKDVSPELVESQRPDSLPEKYSHINQQDARNVYRSIAHEPEVVKALRGYIGATWDECGLTDRQRELLILAVAVEIDSAYEWHQHVRIALLEGLKPDEILAVAAEDYGPFTDTERAVMKFARASSGGTTSDAHVDTLREHFEVSRMSAITALVGAYVCLNVVLQTLNVETEEPFVGWDLAGLEKN